MANYEDYMKSGKKLVRLLFPNHYKSINRVMTRPVDIEEHDITDVTCADICVVTAGVKQRLTKEWIEYDKDHGRSQAIEALMTVMFHYGFQSAMENRLDEKIQSKMATITSVFLAQYKGLSEDTRKEIQTSGMFDFMSGLMFEDDQIKVKK